MRRNRITKRIAVEEIDSAVSSVDVDWRRILDRTESEIARATEVPAALRGGRANARRDSASTGLASRQQQGQGGRRQPDDWARHEGTQEVAFSTEAVDSAAAVRHAVEEAFSRARDIIGEYRDGHIKSEATLLEFASFKAEMGLRAEELELENEELQLSVLSSQGPGAGPGAGQGGRGRHHRAAAATAAGGEAARADLRRGLLQEEDTSAAEDGAALREGGPGGGLRALAGRAAAALPLQRDLARAVSVLGAAAGAYFDSLRTVLLIFSVLSAVSCFVSVLHLAGMSGSVYSNVTSGVGWLPAFIAFSSFSKREGPLYVSLVVFHVAFVIVSAAMRLFREDRVAKLVAASKGSEEHAHSDVILVGWDNSLAGSTAATESAVAAATAAKVVACRDLLEKLRRKHRRHDDDNNRHRALYARRCIGVLGYVCFQAACYITLSYVTTADISIAKKGSVTYQMLRVAMTPFVVSLYNNLFPSVVRAITTLERWDSGVELWVLSTRLYISVIANVTIVGISYGLLADPFLMAGGGVSFGRLRLEQEFFADTFGCRFNQVGTGLAVNIAVDLAVYIAFNLLLPLLRKLSSVVFLYDYRPLEFNLANSVISVLYFVGLLVMAAPFVPLLFILAPLALVLRFKFELFVAMRFCVKPVSSLSASQVSRTFSVYLFSTVVFVGLCGLCFLLACRTFPKDCSIQDRSVGLCADGVDPNTNVCTLDTSSKYYGLYSDAAYCEGGYPACVCSEDLTCGPFLTEYAAIDPIRRYAKSAPSLALLWYLLMEGSAGAWLFLLAAFVIVAFRTNSYRITKGAKEDKEKQFSQQVDALMKDIHRQKRILTRAKEL